MQNGSRSGGHGNGRWGRSTLGKNPVASAAVHGSNSREEYAHPHCSKRSGSALEETLIILDRPHPAQTRGAARRLQNQRLPPVTCRHAPISLRERDQETSAKPVSCHPRRSLWPPSDLGRAHRVGDKIDRRAPVEPRPQSNGRRRGGYTRGVTRVQETRSDPAKSLPSLIGTGPSQFHPRTHGLWFHRSLPAPLERCILLDVRVAHMTSLQKGSL